MAVKSQTLVTFKQMLSPHLLKHEMRKWDGGMNFYFFKLCYLSMFSMTGLRDIGNR